MQALRRGRVEREHDAALVDLVDLGGVDEAVPAGQRAGVEDDPVEDVLVGLGQHVLDLAESLPVAGVDGQAAREREVRGRAPRSMRRTLPVQR